MLVWRFLSVSLHNVTEEGKGDAHFDIDIDYKHQELNMQTIYIFDANYALFVRLKKSALEPSGPPSQSLSQLIIRLPLQFASTHLYAWLSWEEGCTMKVKSFAQEHNTMTQPCREPRPLDLESSTLTM